jgi:intracellular sulfur oxidation DsrE/DsrF family protein
VLLVTPAWSQEPGAQDPRLQDPVQSRANYLVDIAPQSAREFGQLLRRAEKLLVDGVASQEGAARVTFLVHGPEVRMLLRENYLANKEVVDLAASLSALGVVDIKACQTWMGDNGVDEAKLQPFVETVPYAPAELRRLAQEQDYIYF